ncbi:MAG: hypothetical protein AB7G47_19485 [Mycolicibacterium sp.]|uniref:hypothetical protein n=1 Tax=Mycolicibacterium sp. TaxID=2320850 RepID=UPI003D0B2827
MSGVSKALVVAVIAAAVTVVCVGSPGQWARLDRQRRAYLKAVAAARVSADGESEGE